ncbi:MAG: gluconate transporter, partial [Cyclobacteriaceae bacterium]|nr:gluconate transporter [Cyclobacteriaceae bacterium]
NDSGFWLVNKYLNMTEKQTLKSWSVMGTIISVVGFLLILILSFFV